MNRTIGMVRQFHKAFKEAFGCRTEVEPHVPDGAANAVLLSASAQLQDVVAQLQAAGLDLRTARLAMLVEEVRELADALLARDLVGTLDALVDIRYVADGGVLNFGMAEVFDEAFNRVHASNMTKLGPDGRPIYSAAGKVMKGPSYVKADLKDLVASRYVVTCECGACFYPENARFHECKDLKSNDGP